MTRWQRYPLLLALMTALLAFLLNSPRAWLVFMRIMAVALAGFSLAVFL